MSYLDDMEKGFDEPIDPEAFSEPVEIEQEEKAWKKVLLYILRAFVAIIVVLGMIYIYGGLREYLSFRETPEGINERNLAAVVSGEEIELPLRIVVLRNDLHGSRRSEDNIRQLVEDADRVWNQAAIDLEIDEIEEVEVGDDYLKNIVVEPEEFLKTVSPKPGIVNVFLSRRLQGVNGIAFGGTRSLVVADLVGGYDFRVLAHEIGHVLSLDHLEGDDIRLMNREGNGFLITEEEARAAREFYLNM